MFFKIDGDTAKLDDDAFLHGTCAVVATPGSHGNLGDSDVDEGDDVIVPRAVGELLATLKPIPLGDKIAQQLKTEDAGAVVGVVMVLMEEDQVSDGGAEAGHARLNALVEEAINSLILPVGVTPDIPGGDAYKKLGVNKTEVTDEDIEALTAGAPDAIRAAIRAAQYGWDNAWSWLDGDDQVGVKVLTYRYEDLTDNYWDISERFQKVIATNNGPAVVEDWRVLGEAQGTRSDLQGYAHLRRSEEYGTPAASGAPTACLLPFLGVRNIVYRDADGDLHELWSDVRGLTGTTDVTDNAKAPTAAGPVQLRRHDCRSGDGRVPEPRRARPQPVLVDRRRRSRLPTASIGRPPQAATRSASSPRRPTSTTSSTGRATATSTRCGGRGPTPPSTWTSTKSIVPP